LWTLLLLCTIVAIVLLLLGAEAVVRVRQHLKYGAAATLEEQFTVDPTLNLRVPVASFSRGNISINSLGFRGREISASKPPGTIRLAFLGASTTWCAEVSSNEHVWAHLVALELGRRYPASRFDYVNAGVPGYTLESILKSFDYRVAPLHPDVIVIYEAANNLAGEMRQLAAQRGIIKNEQLQFDSWLGRYSLLWNLVEKNLTVLAAQKIARSERERLEVDPRALGAGYKEALLRLVRAAQAHANLVALATFSIQPRRDQSPERQMQASSSALFYMPFLHPGTIISAYERYNEIVREVANETGALLIEGENEIPGDAVHFNDSVHFTDAGSEAMAQRISRALITSPRMQEFLRK